MNRSGELPDMPGLILAERVNTNDEERDKLAHVAPSYVWHAAPYTGRAER